MLGRHTTYFLCLFYAALAFCVCAERGFARAENLFAETLMAPQTGSTIVGFDGCWATTLYYAAQLNRLPLWKPVRDQAVSSTFSGSPVSLVMFSDGAIFGPADRTLSKSGPQVAFASGIDDDAGDAKQERSENEALFYSAANAPNASSENGFHESDGQIRTKRRPAGGSSVPSAANLFPLPAQ